MDEIKAKQQVVEKIKEADKILVTVSNSPSVDALSAALGLALLLDKQEKYATAIFSGETPPAIAFLEPEKTFDDTTDSLRDFIIALNKEKADHLRYKVEGDSVKIFITPYKTTISQDDLEFSQGDYNVELVIALGVNNQDHLDKALEEHGQILHDAAIVTITSGDEMSDLGGIDWHDSNASSLSEMVAGLAEALKDDKKKSLLDGQIATALLTGIVAQTDRFSNEHTTSKVMTVAATLMAAGADQQLIANELQQARSVEIVEEEPEIPESSKEGAEEDAPDSDDGALDIKKDPTKLDIDHDETLAELDERIRGEDAAREKIEEEIEAVEEAAEAAADQREHDTVEATMPKADFVSEDTSSVAVDEPMEDEPTFGGVLNATTDQAEEDARRAIEADQNKTILQHAMIGEAPEPEKTDVLNDQPTGFPGTPPITPGSVGVNSVDDDTVHSAYAAEDSPALGGLGSERVIQPLAHEAAAAAEPAFNPLAPTNEPAFGTPAPTPADFGLPLPPPIPDFSQGFGAPAPAPVVPPAQPGILGDILAPEPPTPSGLDYETTNAIPAPGTAYAIDETPSLPPVPTVEQPQTPPAVPPTPSEPGQFQIPGQPQ